MPKEPAKKTLSQWEHQYNLVFTDPDIGLNQKFTHDEFVEYMLDEVNHPHTMVDHKGRTEWLKYNGYPVTRENLTAELETVNLPAGLEV